MSDLQHVSISVCGHVDSGKSTTTGHLLFKCGGISDREMEKLQKEADAQGKGSFAFAYRMDKQKEERERGITISATVETFKTDTKYYTIIDSPGHRDYVKNMLTGTSQADVGLLLVPADGFIQAIKKQNRSNGDVEGQSRQHAMLINLLGVNQLIVGINKMDVKSDASKAFSEDKFKEVVGEVTRMLKQTGWSKSLAEKKIPIIPFSGYLGDNLIEKSDNMPWYKGCDVKTLSGKEVHVHTLFEALDKFVEIPKRKPDAPLRVPVSGVYTGIKGVGTVYTGCVEQGTLKPGMEIVSVPTHTDVLPCQGKVFSLEMHRKPVDVANPGDNVGMTIKGLKDNIPHTGDVLVVKGDTTIGRCKTFTATVQVMSHPNELKIGYCPIVYVRTAHVPAELVGINWRVNKKDTGGAKVENPGILKTGDTAEVVFEPKKPFVCDSYDNCEGLGRVAVMEGNGLIFLGRISKVEHH